MAGRALLLLCLWAYGLLGWAAEPLAVAESIFRADFDQPTAVAVDAQGRAYVLDGLRRRVVLLSAEGKPLAQFGAGHLNRPLDLVLTEAGLLVADTAQHRLILFGPDGAFRKTLDLPREAEPVAVAVLDGVAYWADRPSHQICMTRLDNGEPQGCFGQRGEGDGQFQYPYQIGIDRDGYLNVVDIINARVQVLDKRGRHFSQMGRFGLSPGELYRPNGLAIDAKTDTHFVSDSYFGTVSVFRKGDFVGLLRGADGQVLHLDSPTGLAWQNGRLYVAETGASQVRRYTVEFRDLPAGAKPDAKAPDIALSQKNCLVCHLSWAEDTPHAIRAADTGGALPEASFKMCYSCHNGAVMDSRHAIHQGAQHPTVYEPEKERRRHAKEQPRKDKLPKDFPVTANKELLCTACHTPHTDEKQTETLYQGHENSWLRISNQGGDLCERCHESQAKGAYRPAAGARWQAQGYNHPLGIRFTAPPHPDAKGHPTNAELHKGLPAKLADAGAALGHEQGLVCQTCHQVHGGHGDAQLTALSADKGELCAACHPRQSSKDDKDAHAKGVHPVNLARKGEHPGEHPVLWKGKPELTEVTCAACHQVHQGTAGTPLFPKDIDSGKALCKNCHERQHSDSPEEAHRKGVHPVNVKRDEPIEWRGEKIKEVTCETCHKVHSGSPDTSLLPEGIAKAEALCEACHDRQHAKDKDDARRKGVHPVNAKLDEPVEIAGQKIEKVGCLSCHAVHKGKPDTAALVETDRDGQLCNHCHEAKQTVVGTDHDLRITAKDQANAHDLKPAESGVCGACHSLHRGKGELPYLYAAKRVGTPLPNEGKEKLDETPFKRDALCLGCHRPDGTGEKKVVQHFSHPYEDLVLRSDQKLMPLLGPDEKPADFGRIACATCHEPHIWKPADKPLPGAKIVLSANHENLEGTQRDSFLRHKGGVAGTFCIDCHGQEGLVKYLYFHEEKRARNRGLDYLK